MGEEVVDDAGFTISARQVDPDIRLVAIAGDLDVRTVPRTTAFLTEGAALIPRHLILDLSEVTFLTSSGIGLLIATGDTGIHGQLHLVGVLDNPAVKRPLAMVGFFDRLDVAPIWTPCSPGSRARPMTRQNRRPGRPSRCSRPGWMSKHGRTPVMSSAADDQVCRRPRRGAAVHGSSRAFRIGRHDDPDACGGQEPHAARSRTRWSRCGRWCRGGTRSPLRRSRRRARLPDEQGTRRVGANGRLIMNGGPSDRIVSFDRFAPLVRYSCQTLPAGERLSRPRRKLDHPLRRDVDRPYAMSGYAAEPAWPAGR